MYRITLTSLSSSAPFPPLPNSHPVTLGISGLPRHGIDGQQVRVGRGEADQGIDEETHNSLRFVDGQWEFSTTSRVTTSRLESAERSIEGDEQRVASHRTARASSRRDRNDAVFS